MELRKRAGLSMDGRWYQAKSEEEYVSGYTVARMAPANEARKKL